MSQTQSRQDRNFSREEFSYCNSQAIHNQEKIQSFGLFLEVDLKTNTIKAASNNIFEISLFKDLPSIIDQPIESILKNVSWNTVKTRIRKLGRKHLYLHSSDYFGTGQSYVLHIASNPNSYLLEFEPLEEQETTEWDKDNTPLQTGLDIKLSEKITDTNSPNKIVEAIVEEVHQKIGFERTLLYVFHEDWHGSVELEFNQDNSEPEYLGLHFPASDIPSMARLQYIKNNLRYMANRESPSIDLVKSSDFPAKVDLTQSYLRAIAPVHLEYQKNMSVISSVSAAIIVDNKLYGLIACHQYSKPKAIPLIKREWLREFVAKSSKELESAISKNNQVESAKNWNTLQNFIVDKPNDPNLTRQILDKIRVFLEADQICLFDNYSCQVVLDTEPLPDSIDLKYIKNELIYDIHSEFFADDSAQSNEKVGGCFLNTQFHGFAFANFNLPVDRISLTLFCFRKETVQKLNWGGDPKKTKSDEEGIISPRQSFKQWQEEIRNHSLAFDKKFQEKFQQSLSLIANNLPIFAPSLLPD